MVLISIGKNRFVDEMEDPNISCNVPSINLLSERADSKGAKLPKQFPETRTSNEFLKVQQTGTKSYQSYGGTKCVLRRGPFLLGKGIGKLFRDIQVFQGGLFRQQHRRWFQNWYVTAIKMNGKQMEPYIGVRYNPC